MQLTCSHAALRTVVNAAARVAATSRGIAHVLIEANETGVAVTGEGSTHRVRSLIEADVRTAGAVSLPARSFDSLLSSISGDVVRLSRASLASLDFRCGDHNTQLRTIDTEETGEWPSRVFTEVMTVPADELRGAIMRTVFIATDEATVTLLSGGVLLDTRDSLVRLTGMDRTRLSVSAMRSAKYSTPLQAVIVPAPSLSEVERVITGSERVSIATGGTEIRFAGATWEVRSRTIESVIPEFDSRIPHEFVTEARVRRHELLETLIVATIFSIDEPKSVRLHLDSKKNRCVVTTKGSELGRQHSEIPATIVGQDAIAEVSVRVLMDGVRSSSQEAVELRVTEPPLQRCLLNTTEHGEDVYVFAVVA